eukprot:TRINITY_DN3374_c0_g1_i5.p1 TRINITY_DN3374_c0_g1~~TRINITY_DN3374_c0_g1_i5.p1  ORF type:complete len:263 (+),score=65.38 TRINITY_DN3374_c0_g1_i5:109-897(+)
MTSKDAGKKLESLATQELEIDPDLLNGTPNDILARARLLDSETKILQNELLLLTQEIKLLKEKTKENVEKIKLNKQLPYLVGHVVEILELPPTDQEEEEGAIVDLDANRKGKCVVIKTSTRQTMFLPVVGLVDESLLKPGDLIGVNKDTYLILDTLPPEYDSRVKAMEVDEKPREKYIDIGGLHQQLKELQDAVVLPILRRDLFTAIRIQPPKGVLLYGPPGTGKTLMARACANETNATFLKLAGPQLVQVSDFEGCKFGHE